MNEETRVRLIKLLGMLGSAHDGEVVAAARAIEKLRAGAPWGDLLALGMPAAPVFDPNAWDDLVRQQGAAQQQPPATPFRQTWRATEDQVERVRREREREARRVRDAAFGPTTGGDPFPDPFTNTFYRQF